MGYSQEAWGCPRAVCVAFEFCTPRASLSWGSPCNKSGVGRKVLVHGGHCWPRVCVFQHRMICLFASRVSCTSCRLAVFLSPGLSVSLVKSHSCWRIWREPVKPWGSVSQALGLIANICNIRNTTVSSRNYLRIFLIKKVVRTRTEVNDSREAGMLVW